VPERILLTGGRVIDPESGRDEEADVLIHGNRIAKIGSIRQTVVKSDQLVKAKGLLIAPGLVDLHAHLREPGREDEETIASGSRAAAKGGYTTVCCMPNTEPPLDDQGKIRLVYERATPNARVFPIGTVSKGREGKELTEVGDLFRAGAVAVSDDGSPVANADLMRRALEYTRLFDLPVIDHCEEPTLFRDGVMNEGFVSTRLGLRGIPNASEDIMVSRNLHLVALTRGRLHLAHLSTSGSVSLLREAKQRGLTVTGEVTPHHLTLTDEALLSYDTNVKVNPPLRSKADLEALRAGLADGTVDVIATDHAPHSIVEKETEFDLAPFGMIGLETALGLILTELVHSGRLGLIQALRAMSLNPCLILKLPFGRLVDGGPADLVCIDLKKSWVVNPDQFVSKSRNTPFAGRRLKGKAVHTLVDGSFALKEGRLNEDKNYPQLAIKKVRKRKGE
jgi:dihydroorotase